MAREDWKILRALSEIAGLTLPYSTLAEVRARMEQLAPHLVRYNALQPSAFDQLAQRLGAGPSPGSLDGREPLRPWINALKDYYMTDAIGRASKTMSQCVQAVQRMA